jgi:hypothetical protein
VVTSRSTASASGRCAIYETLRATFPDDRYHMGATVADVVRLPRCELLRHCLRGASPAFRIEVAPHTTRCHRQVRCVVLAKQMDEVALDNNPGTARLHGAGNPLVDVNISADAAKRNAGAKAADRSACDRNDEVGLRMPVHHPACLTGAVPNSDDPATTFSRILAIITSAFGAPEKTG